ncbi:MAG TPA: hypothetical protein VGQ72_10520 [Pyrinomonadaceae bacterium]|jgi:hypothetical protein|nr:hypothetical protein [Pyrinomonadaceae bacterium]
MDSSSGCHRLDELERLCHEKTKELSELVGKEFQLAWPPPGKGELWNIRPWEIESFMRGYRKLSLFTLEPHIGRPTKNRPDGCPSVRYGGALMARRKNGQPYTHEFLRCFEGPKTYLYKPEDIIQMCAATELVEVYQQPSERMLLEGPLYADASLNIAASNPYAIDLVVFDGPREVGKPVMGGEMKVLRGAHDELVNAMNKCGGRLLSKKACGGDHNKCLWIRQNRTVKYLWVCSRGNDDLHQELFKVRRSIDGGFNLKEVKNQAERDRILSRQAWS